MLLGDFQLSTFCSETAEILRMVGWVITIFKVLIPIIIIIYGMLDFGKAVVASKDEEIKSSAKSLGFRVAAGVIIFFIPNLVLWVFGTITDYSDQQKGFTNCKACLLKPHSSECQIPTK